MSAASITQPCSPDGLSSGFRRQTLSLRKPERAFKAGKSRRISTDPLLTKGKET